MGASMRYLSQRFAMTNRIAMGTLTDIGTSVPILHTLLFNKRCGPDGEMGASMRYLSQRFAMTNRIAMGTLTDIGTSVPILHTLLFNKRCF